MAWYRVGTVNMTNNSNTVVGIGTAWVQAAAIGETFLGPDGSLYEITAINSNTSLSISPAYKGPTSTAQGYAIMPTQGYLRDLAAAAAALVESYSSVKNNAGAGKFAAGTSASPSLRNAADENSGLNFKGNDQIALVTAGVERLAISADGTPSGTAVEKMPVSTAQQAALNAKANSANPVFSGSVTHGESARGWTLNPNLGIRTESNAISGVHLISGPTSQGRIWFSDTDAEYVGGIVYDHSLDSLTVVAGSGGLRTPPVFVATTASAANVFVASNGYLQRSTSSAKYKTQIEPVDDVLMQRIIDEAEPIWYRSLCDADPDDFSYWGLIAESLGDVDPRFVHWARPMKTVEHSEQIEEQVDTGEVDEHGQPIYRTETRTETVTEQVPDLDAPLQAEGVMYERLVVPLLWHAKKQELRVGNLEQDNAELKLHVEGLMRCVVDLEQRLASLEGA